MQTPMADTMAAKHRRRVDDLTRSVVVGTRVRFGLLSRPQISRREQAQAVDKGGHGVAGHTGEHEAEARAAQERPRQQRLAQVSLPVGGGRWALGGGCGLLGVALGLGCQGPGPAPDKRQGQKGSPSYRRFSPFCISNHDATATPPVFSPAPRINIAMCC